MKRLEREERREQRQEAEELRRESLPDLSEFGTPRPIASERNRLADPQEHGLSRCQLQSSEGHRDAHDTRGGTRSVLMRNGSVPFPS
jgi:hypothetical protein